MSAVRPSLVYALAREYVLSGWTQGSFARDESGTGALPTAKRAACWCVVGAIERASADLDCPTESSAGLSEDFARAVHVDAGCVGHWNDHPQRTQRQVASALEFAAHLAALNAL